MRSPATFSPDSAANASGAFNTMPRLTSRSPSSDERARRIVQLSREWGLVLPPTPSPLTRPQLAPTFRKPDDEADAEDFLKRRQLQLAASQSSSNLKRAFTIKRKGWDQKEVFDALSAHISSGGRPGVAEVLVQKLLAAGGDLNGSQKAKSSVLNRRSRSIEDFGERRKLLQMGIQSGRADILSILVPHADQLALDTSLPMAMRKGDLAVVELLLRYGASAVQTADGQDAFRQACAVGGQAELVGLVLRSDGRPSASWVSQSMVDATRIGCLETVLRLSRSTADGNYNDAEPLKIAISQARHDIALAIIMGNKPPQRPGLDQAFQLLFDHQTVKPDEKLAVAELLLCAGAQGEVLASALTQSAEAEFLDMVQLLVQYGASIEYEDAKAVRRAIASGRPDLSQTLLGGNASLSPIYASEFVALIPRNATFEHRRMLLEALLRKGAAGIPLSDCLIDCVEDGDTQSIRLLLTSQYPEGGQSVEGHDLGGRSSGLIFDRHAVASVDHKAGIALQIAVMKTDIEMAKLILSGNPSAETLSAVFPMTRGLSPAGRLGMVECFLSIGMPAPAVLDALEEAIAERPPQRDENMIALLLDFTFDANFNNGAILSAAITQRDIGLLSRLLKKNVVPRTAAANFARAIEIHEPKVRYEMANLLLEAGAAIDTAEISKGMLSVLDSHPGDIQLLRLLLLKGHADINIQDGTAVSNAIANANPAVLDTLLQHGKPSADTLKKGLGELALQPSTPAKAAKLETLLRKVKDPESLSAMLPHEVRYVLDNPPHERACSIIETLLAAGASVDGHRAAALCLAVAAADAQVTDLLLAARPDPNSLARALPHALNISDPMDRQSFAEKLLAAGAPAVEANRALCFAISSLSEQLGLIRTLVASADTADGEALSAAVKKGNPRIIELVLQRKQAAPEMLSVALLEATKGKDHEARVAICTTLLRAGASGTAVSDALLSAAGEGDLDLGQTLLAHGGSVEHRDGQAVVEACRAGSAKVLRMLLGGNAAVKKPTLEKAFQAATEVRDLQKRAEVFKILLEKGVSGDVVDAQLASAIRYGDEGEVLMRVLIGAGADPDYNSGEAVWAATGAAFLKELDLILGNIEVGGGQRKPSPSTIVRGMKAALKLSPEPRLAAMNSFIKAGLPVTEELHIALNKAVNEEIPDLHLIRLLLQHGASPLTNCCSSLIDAAKQVNHDVVGVLLESEISPKELSWVFSKSITRDNAEAWYTLDGLQVVQMFLAKGARGDALSIALAIVIERSMQDSPGPYGEFLDLLLKHGVDVNLDNGAVLQEAASRGDSTLIAQLLQLRPSAETLSRGLSRVFDHELPDEEALKLVTLFTEYEDGEIRLQDTANEPGSESVLFKCLQQYPRSTRLLKTLLEAGFYHDQTTNHQVMPDLEEEQVTLLTWAILQPQKRISSSVIQVLIDSKAKVNFETRISRTTPLMLAVQARRHDIVKMLLLEGAEADVSDITGNTPLAMASEIGGELSVTIMTNLLAAGTSPNDGSLHNAARELNLAAVQVLVQFGHHPDFPSHLHDGRSALAELCLHASDAGELTAAQERAMEKVIAKLIQKNSDMSIKSKGKSVLLLAMESADPVATTRALIKVCMWEHVNKSFNLYTDGTYTYSPTAYATRVLPASPARDELLQLLYAARAEDVYYINEGPQPEDAVGLPAEIEERERERKMRADRLELLEEEHQIAMARTRELADVQAEIFAAQKELEEAHRRRAAAGQLGDTQAQADLEESLFNQAMRRRRSEQGAELAHRKALAEASVHQAKVLAAAETEAQRSRRVMQLEWDKKEGQERVGNAKTLSAIRVEEREHIDKLDRTADGRFQKRVDAQKRLVESQNALAGRLAGSGVGQRQIGYIAGELN